MLAKMGSVLVRVDLFQTDEAVINGNFIKTGKRYNDNFREKNPCIGYIEDGYGELPTGSWAIFNYNHFDYSSPYRLSENLFSVPLDEEVLAIIDKDGDLIPVCGNVLCERIGIETLIDVPDDFKKNYDDRGIVVKGTSGYKKGQFVIWMPMSDYEICYMWNGEERRKIKVHLSEIVGILKI